jgi:hypothetical protein
VSLAHLTDTEAELLVAALAGFARARETSPVRRRRALQATKNGRHVMELTGDGSASGVVQAAVVQAAPVAFDLDATLAKVEALTAESAS